MQESIAHRQFAEIIRDTPRDAAAIHPVTAYDYAVLVFYFAYMVAISWVFRRFVTNFNDYFRGGGKALWWLVGGSAFMAPFSAWTFTAAASKAYAEGWPVTIIFVANAIAFVFNATYFAPRFRQLRVITPVEAIRMRFGRTSEQFFIWLQLPVATLQCSVWLTALGVFFSAVFGLDVSTTIVVTGIVVLLMALLGGTWAVLAGDFMQVLVLMPVCLTVSVLALLRVGGWTGFASGLPAGHLDLEQVFSREFLGLWCCAMLLKQTMTNNNLREAGRYLSVKDSRHARWAGYLGAILFCVGVVIWFVPPMAARVLFPDLRAAFPNLKVPEEASFIAMAREVMPVGMMGLLVSGIFAATMSGMGASLNQEAGIIIRNFYQPFLRPAASDRHYLAVGRAATVCFGLAAIVVALKMSELQKLSLFLQMQRVSILVTVPVAVPLLLGLILRRTPPWSAWSTVLVGFVCSLFVGDLLTPDWAAKTFGVTLAGASREYWTQGVQFFGNVFIASAWFCGTALFWSRTSTDHRASVAQFSARLETPVDFDREEGAANANDREQESTIGWLSLAYGTFVMALALIPNTTTGRVAFIASGGIVVVVGLLLLRASQRHPPREADPPRVSPLPSESRETALAGQANS